MCNYLPVYQEHNVCPNLLWKTIYCYLMGIQLQKQRQYSQHKNGDRTFHGKHTVNPKPGGKLSNIQNLIKWLKCKPHS